MNILPGWFFLIDLTLNFNLAYYEKGVIITNRKKIVRNYLTTEFFYDTFIISLFLLAIYLNI